MSYTAPASATVAPRVTRTRAGKLFHEAMLTERVFANWPAVLAGIVLSYVNVGGREITFRARSGVTITCPNVKDTRCTVVELLCYETYGPLSQLTQAARPGAVVLDVGGHIGAFACAISEMNPTCRVWSYEPSPASFSWLQRNIESNNVAERLHGVNAAVGKEEGTRILYEIEGTSCENSFFARVGATERTVSQVSLASAIQQAGGRVDLLKLDCEGAEYEIILESSSDIWSKVRSVVLEYHPVAGHSFAQIDQHLHGLGLVLRWNYLERAGLGIAYLSRE